MENNSKKTSFIDKILQNKKIQYVFIALLSILVIFIFCFNFNLGKSDLTSSKDDLVLNYVSELEDTLSKTLSKVKGAGDVSVVITIKSGVETVLAMNTTTKKTDSGTEIVETPIILNGKTVVLKEMYPEILGVLIVAEGADSLSVLTKIQQATKSLLNINVNQIEILTMK